ncbi:Hpt domain-containing protein [Pseudomonas sp. SWI6]|uniref:Hpt domain-containing protein n=1 Tax=Pseudomonas taiwanensis TaxID=470150 RepID=A0ABR6VAD7_9PSED|nr:MULTISPECIES: Hpt domain-containing protein [Pseudomonas]AVD82302.1 Hpt domain-containing protein [Pseudomonas sp. SWI6]AVD89259.1 Hpt domain-containing protein [Pseudomonas sp. SWI44]MBC3477359.1 Hpt domain-containing protein [Pseudomonas taiwanensis]MBC3492845.1 Hpt domain-containing protein [Pseudomonas taiwanensis]MDT8924373.1 Hpt domain-containing protein [Pseudomonas taiwanensis]
MTDMHIDFKVLSDLQEVMEDGYLQLLETFLEDSERRLSQLHEAKNAHELGIAAHSFKGSSSNMGAVGLASLCHELEERVRQQPLYGIEDLINRIDQEYLEVQRFYRGERARVSAG